MMTGRHRRGWQHRVAGTSRSMARSGHNHTHNNPVHHDAAPASQHDTRVKKAAHARLPTLVDAQEHTVLSARSVWACQEDA